MSRRLLALMGAALLIIAIGYLSSSPVYAQCGTGSTGSCVRCHIEQAPVYEEDLWHGVHARKDCCTNCHGGNCSAAEKELAHVGIIPNPLQDVYTNCHACHPDDYWQRAEIFAVELHITPASRATPTPVSTSDPANRHPNVVIRVPAEPAPLVSILLTLIPAFVGLMTIATFFGISYLTHRMSTH